MPPFDSEYEEKLYNDRLASLHKIRDIGVERLGLSAAEAAYPNSFRFTHTIPQLRALGDPLTTEQLEAHPIHAAVAGRVMAHRIQGKAGFAQLQAGGWTTSTTGDTTTHPTESAPRIQIYVRKDDVGEDLFELYKLLHLGDIIGVRGTLMRTRTGELTLKVHSLSLPEIDTPRPDEPKPNTHPLQLLSKAMLALPDKYHGLEDVELRYRQRYVDLIMNSGSQPKSTTDPGAPRLASETWAGSPQPSNTPQNAVITPADNAVILSEAKDPRISATASAATARTASSTPSNAVILSEARSAQSKDPRISSESPQISEEPTEPRNVREVFVKRAAILRAIRRFFDARGFLEVETPMMQTIAGGAAARPFTTHHNALDIDLHLRIAPELYLKRLVVGGLDRVYEINRNFRNEGVSTQHNPEFTMLEFYQAYANYHDLMDLTQELITFVANEVNGTTITHFPIPKGPRAGEIVEIDLANWQKLSMREAIIRLWPRGCGAPPTMDSFNTLDGVKDLYWRLNIGGDFERVDPDHGPDAANLGKRIASLFEAVAEPHLIQPTIIYDFPLAVSPLSKVKPDEPDWVERFEFYIGGFEVGNAFSELNDPEDQRKRFEDQLKERDRGDDEAHQMDEDYVRALSFGLPPTAGEGIGIDRLTMILTGSRSIRDVILFPLMRPLTKPPEEHTHGESAE